MSSPTKLVVIAVDFDNDIGKLGINTPVLGYDNILKIANEYALTAPQDSDLNVLFTALKLYRDLKKDESYSAEIALVAGDENSSSRAGIKISRELDRIIEITKANNAIVVVDSVEDEKVLPVIQSKVNVVGVERVVVEQLRGVEETYVLLGRYLRKVLEERRFSKIFLGLPGLIILAYSLLLTMNLVTYITPTISIIIAAFLIFKGFGLDEFVGKWWRLSPITRISLILSTISTAMTVIILYITLASRNFSSDIMSITLYVSNTIPFLLLSLIPLIGGRLTLRILRRSIRVWRDLITLTVIIMLYGLITRISELILTTKPTDIQQVLLLLNEYKITNMFFIYVIIIMTVSAVLYVIERTAT